MLPFLCFAAPPLFSAQDKDLMLRSVAATSKNKVAYIRMQVNMPRMMKEKGRSRSRMLSSPRLLVSNFWLFEKNKLLFKVTRDRFPVICKQKHFKLKQYLTLILVDESTKSSNFRFP